MHLAQRSSPSYRAAGLPLPSFTTDTWFPCQPWGWCGVVHSPRATWLTGAAPGAPHHCSTRRHSSEAFPSRPRHFHPAAHEATPPPCCRRCRPTVTPPAAPSRTRKAGPPARRASRGGSAPPPPPAPPPAPPPPPAGEGRGRACARARLRPGAVWAGGEGRAHARGSGRCAGEAAARPGRRVGGLLCSAPRGLPLSPRVRGGKELGLLLSSQPASAGGGSFPKFRPEVEGALIQLGARRLSLRGPWRAAAARAAAGWLFWRGCAESGSLVVSPSA